MSWFFAVLLVLVVGAVVVVLLGGGGSAAPEYDDLPDVGLPTDRPLSGADLREVRLNTAVRGYRAEEVDDLLERLAQQLDAAGRDPATGPADAADRRPGLSDH